MTVQSVTIPNWVPEPLANGAHGHWSTRQRKLRNAQETVWVAAMQAGWHFVPGRVRLTITFTFPQKRRRDLDNLFARAKGCVDGLREHRIASIDGIALPQPTVRRGWFTDDSTDWLDLSVKADVRKGELGTHILLEPA